MNWITEICAANAAFKQRIQIDALPIERSPCPYAVITCMDPRVNLEAIGIPAFSANGAAHSQIRVVRSIGAIHEDRSNVIGIHLAGFREVVVLMHTDCGCCLAHSKIDVITRNLEQNLSPQKLRAAKKIIGEPLADNLQAWLQSFEDPRLAVKREVLALRRSAFVPDDLILHGLVYDLATANVEVVVNGYE